MFSMILTEGRTERNGERVKTEEQREKVIVLIVINVLWSVPQGLISEMVSSLNVSTVQLALMHVTK